MALIKEAHSLRAINGNDENWLDQVHQQLEAGSNFLLILPNNEQAVADFCKTFGYQEDCTPKSLSRGEFFLLSQFIDSENFDEVLRAWDDDHQIIYVEQLDFPVNRPPRLAHYIVYSPVFGIVSQHEDQREARRALSRYESSEYYHPGTRRAAIYAWEEDRWEMLED